MTWIHYPKPYFPGGVKYSLQLATSNRSASTFPMLPVYRGEYNLTPQVRARCKILSSAHAQIPCLAHVPETRAKKYTDGAQVQSTRDNFFSSTTLSSPALERPWLLWFSPKSFRLHAIFVLTKSPVASCSSPQALTGKISVSKKKKIGAETLHWRLEPLGIIRWRFFIRGDGLSLSAYPWWLPSWKTFLDGIRHFPWLYHPSRKKTVWG